MNYTITQDEAPCYLHKSHSPITVINEEHHPFPQAWQKNLWGEVRDDRTVPLCATGHNTVHYALLKFEQTGKWPDWCVGSTRDLCELAYERLHEAENNV